MTVLAKTTGSRPVLILPDGSEQEIIRPGNPSIREQLRVVARAAALKADVLVTELMSIGGECLSTESRRILRPGILALTNVRLDHLDAMGPGREDIARTLASAFPWRGTIFFPKEEFHGAFEARAGRLSSKLVAVERRAGETEELPPGEFESNLRLALAVVESLGVDRGLALRGMRRAPRDFGSLRIWRAEFGTPPRPALCVSAFAANDPESSAAVLDLVKPMLPPDSGPLVGILCLREDRGDRTLQWTRAAGAGFFSEFGRVAVAGGPARAMARKLRREAASAFPKFSFFADPRPADLMNHLIGPAGPLPVVFGLGNILGHGERIVRFWEGAGTPYGR